MRAERAAFQRKGLMGCIEFVQLVDGLSVDERCLRESLLREVRGGIAFEQGGKRCQCLLCSEKGKAGAIGVGERGGYGVHAVHPIGGGLVRLVGAGGHDGGIV